jgi:hypothetical protein
MASLLSYALTNKSDVKESLGIAASDTTWDNLCIRMINKATLAIENYCGRRFAETTYTDELYNTNYNTELVLKQRPITSTTTFSLSVRDTSLNSNDWEPVDSELYFVDAASGVIYLDFNTYLRRKGIKVTYSAGYDIIPDDLAEACVALACYWVQNADAGNIGIMEKLEGQRRVRYTSGSLTFNMLIDNLGINAILDSYSNLPVATDR